MTLRRGVTLPSPTTDERAAKQKVAAAEMVHLWVEEGLSVAEISRAVSVNMGTVSRRLEDAGVRQPYSAYEPLLSISEVERLRFSEKLTIKQVAERVGFSETTVRAYLRAAGHPSARPGRPSHQLQS
jgi:DNA-binding CsgD family transcriptional regulator